MKVTSVTIKYEAKRSGEYQSATVGAEVSAQVEEGEDFEGVFADVLRLIAPVVDGEAARKLNGLIEDDRAMRGL